MPTGKIKSCPFCGSERTDVMQHFTLPIAYVFCMSCYAHGPEKRTSEKAIAAWNQVVAMRELADYISQGRVFEDISSEDATHEDMGRHVWPDRYTILLQKANQALKGVNDG